MKYAAAKSCRDLCWKDTSVGCSLTLVTSTPVSNNKPSSDKIGDLLSNSACKISNNDQILV